MERVRIIVYGTLKNKDFFRAKTGLGVYKEEDIVLKGEIYTVNQYRSHYPAIKLTGETKFKAKIFHIKGTRDEIMHLFCVLDTYEGYRPPDKNNSYFLRKKTSKGFIYVGNRVLSSHIAKKVNTVKDKIYTWKDNKWQEV